MPILTLTHNDETRNQDFPKNTILTNAIEQMGVDIGHRCGGQSKCTSCRVIISAGEPADMTRAEYAKLKDKGFLGEARLSCQILLEQDMTVQPVITLQHESAAEWTDTGKALTDTVQPEAVWLARAELESEAS